MPSGRAELAANYITASVTRPRPMPGHVQQDDSQKAPSRGDWV